MLFAVPFVSDIIKSSVIKILTIHSQRVLARSVLTVTARWGVLKLVLEAGARSCITTANYILCFAGAALGLLAQTFAQDQGLLRMSPIPTPQEKDRSFSMLVSVERHSDWDRTASEVSGSFSGGTYSAAVATVVWNVWSNDSDGGNADNYISSDHIQIISSGICVVN